MKHLFETQPKCATTACDLLDSWIPSDIENGLVCPDINVCQQQMTLYLNDEVIDPEIAQSCSITTDESSNTSNNETTTNNNETTNIQNTETNSSKSDSGFIEWITSLFSSESFYQPNRKNKLMFLIILLIILYLYNTSFFI